MNKIAPRISVNVDDWILNERSLLVVERDTPDPKIAQFNAMLTPSSQKGLVSLHTESWIRPEWHYF